MANKDLKLSPHQATKGWWYEEPKGIYVCPESVPAEGFYISWKAIKNALKRKEKED